jgi:aminopeptidase N
VRPDSFIEISNFYTATIYNKGAELIRMMKTILGEEKYRAGTDLYFERFDGQAVTCDDFVATLEDASGVDLSHFKLWYGQAGTPKVKARLEHDPASGEAVLHLEQSVPPTPGQPVKNPMVIPLKTALVGEKSGAEIAPERLIVLDQPAATVRFEGLLETPLLSINRDFSAPVIVDAKRRPGELEKLAASDSNPFARYEAIQELMLRWLIAEVRGEGPDQSPVIDAIANTLRSNALDSAFKAEAILLPSESVVGDRMDVIEPDAIHSAREKLRSAIGGALSGEFEAAQRPQGFSGDEVSAEAKGARRLRSIALNFIAAVDTSKGARLAKAQFDSADNMTDRIGALAALASLDAPEREEALQAFYRRYEKDPLVIDKWFAVQARAERADTIDQVEALTRHDAFNPANPNRLRSLGGVFGMNQWAFNDRSGRGYRFLADLILTADKLNPQVAARLLTPFGKWRRFDETRSTLMRSQLERILAAPGLSKDVYEQVSKSLA